MIEDRELWCDVCGQRFGSVHPDERPLLYTPLDFCPADGVPAIALVWIWGALPDGEAARLAAPLVGLVNRGPRAGSERKQLKHLGTLRALAAHANGHLKDAVRQDRIEAEVPSQLGTDTMLRLIGSADWSLTLGLAELAPFLARMEPDERRSLDKALMQAFLVLVRERDSRARAVAVTEAAHALLEAVLQVVAFAFMSEPGTWLEKEHWTGEDHLAAGFGITTDTMHRILEAMGGYGLVGGR